MKMLSLYPFKNETLRKEAIAYNLSSVGFDDTTVNSPTKGANVIMTEEIMSYFLLINFWGPGQCVTIIGLIVNILNIIIFVRQGLRDSVNISLLGLTISDLGSLAFLFFLNLCWTPSITKLDLPFYPQQIMYFLFWGHVIFTRVTTGTTAWIAMERCMCIVAPLKIKSLVTPGRTVTFISVLYIIMFGAISPMFYTSKFTWIFDSGRNKSLLGYVKIASRSSIENIVYLVNNILPIIFFILIVLCTAVLVKTLHKNAKWRQRTTSTKANVLSKRDTKVVKMVLIISIVFIFCYAPGAVFFIWPLADPQMKIAGSEKNFVIAVFSLLLHLEGINASANFFIYMLMSSKFKSTFKQLFCFHYREQNEKDVEN